MVPRPWYGERIEGTLTYTNNTVTELSRYVHAFVDAGFRLDQGELSYESAPRNEMSEGYGTVKDSFGNSIEYVTYRQEKDEEL